MRKAAGVSEDGGGARMQDFRCCDWEWEKVSLMLSDSRCMEGWASPYLAWKAHERDQDPGPVIAV
jgi:hypothetical protein